MKWNSLPSWIPFYLTVEEKQINKENNQWWHTIVIKASYIFASLLDLFLYKPNLFILEGSKIKKENNANDMQILINLTKFCKLLSGAVVFENTYWNIGDSKSLLTLLPSEKMNNGIWSVKKFTKSLLRIMSFSLNSLELHKEMTKVETPAQCRFYLEFFDVSRVA